MFPERGLQAILRDVTAEVEERAVQCIPGHKTTKEIL
jgi:hypothetical protein